MFIYTLLVGFVGVCTALLLIVIGNIAKNYETIFALFGKDLNTAEMAPHKAKMDPLFRAIGNLLMLIGIGMILAVVYLILFSMSFWRW
jgi:hypothetical protein